MVVRLLVIGYCLLANVPSSPANCETCRYLYFWNAYEYGKFVNLAAKHFRSCRHCIVMSKNLNKHIKEKKFFFTVLVPLPLLVTAILNATKSLLVTT
jgi:hypothetical protein